MKCYLHFTLIQSSHIRDVTGFAKDWEEQEVFLTNTKGKKNSYQNHMVFQQTRFLQIGKYHNAIIRNTRKNNYCNDSIMKISVHKSMPSKGT